VRNANTNGNGDRNGHCNGDRNRNGYCYCDCHCNSYGDSDSNGDPHSDRDSDPASANTKAAAYTVAAPDAVSEWVKKLQKDKEITRNSRGNSRVPCL
jgi:hypothetical protein